jgi:alkylation response protein AidB-like acyl-CoA dehydrogenase
MTVRLNVMTTVPSCMNPSVSTLTRPASGRDADGRSSITVDRARSVPPSNTGAGMAKLLAAEASWEAANVCLDTHGGFGFAADYDVERKFRETRLYKIAPVSNNLILAHLAQHTLGMPRSY